MAPTRRIWNKFFLKLNVRGDGVMKYILVWIRNLFTIIYYWIFVVLLYGGQLLIARDLR